MFRQGVYHPALWTGSWNVGEITVPDTSKYLLYKISMYGMGTAILAIRNGNHIRGIGGYATAAGNILSYHFAATISGDTWTFVACKEIRHNDNVMNDATVTGIAGLI